MTPTLSPGPAGARVPPFPFHPEVPVSSSPLVSMTGFARADGADDVCVWSWEIKSVNAKGRDIRFRLPAGWDGQEGAWRQRIGARIQRGTLTAQLTLSRRAEARTVRINESLLNRLVALREQFADRIADTPPRLEALLAVRGVVEEVEPEETAETLAARTQAVTADLDRALDGLDQARRAEGARLAVILAEHLETIDRLGRAAGAAAALQPEALRTRLLARLADLRGQEPPLAEDRLAQEIALLVARADVREELDRLAAHVAAARDLLASGAGIGRRLDFLCQELNREANTLCSKAAELDLTRLGLDLKAAIEQLREQVQNVE